MECKLIFSKTINQNPQKYFYLSKKWLPNQRFSFRIIFKKVAKLMGGKVRLMMSGGAPLSPDTHEQIKLCLCIDVIQGYGLTETTSSATVMDGNLNLF